MSDRVTHVQAARRQGRSAIQELVDEGFNRIEPTNFIRLQGFPRSTFPS